MKSLVLHDYFETPDGGGRLSCDLAAGLGADLAYGFLSPGHPFFKGPEAVPEASRIDLGVRCDTPGLRQLRLALAFLRRSSFVSNYETAIYSGSYAPLAVRNPALHNILYCHTPPRFLYDQREHFLSLVAPWQRPLFLALTGWLKSRYEAAVTAMNTVLANSGNVQRRIRSFLGHLVDSAPQVLNAEIVYPPCHTGRYAWLGQDGYYLSLARLDALKRVEMVVEAFARMPDKRLVVASTGPELAKIQLRARGLNTISIIGPVGETRLRELLGRCVATVYVPVDEDFGLTPVESMAAGKPVIGVAEGGLLETVLHGETGTLLPPAFGVQDLIQAVRDMTPGRARAMREPCRTRAQLFDITRFLERMTDVAGR
ncbi:glycosyltransferase [Desulfocurvibacter africanus]|uniref:glycosyltransferase n=1 Tax=Desulfocurvibacter africanus TaxID=873 RepID=UPI0003FBE1AE|nr:glycosyltransferase [Desulfocurvibacter africanus]